MDQIGIEIDRIILTNLNVAPERAEHIRALIEMELQRRLERGGLPEGLRNTDIIHIQKASMMLTKPQSDALLANDLAQRILQSLHKINGQSLREQKHDRAYAKTEKKP